MAFRLFRRHQVRIVTAGLGIFLLLPMACATEEAAATPVATPRLVAATVTPQQPAATTTSPSAFPPIPEPRPTVAGAAPLTPAASPTPTPPPILTTTPMPQTVGLKLEVVSPQDNTVVSSNIITVAGLTSPDATVSVNGQLVKPDPDGRFSTELPITESNNPLLIEVIATSISGEQRSLIRTVIYIS